MSLVIFDLIQTFGNYAIGGLYRLLLPWIPYGYISLLMAFWSILVPDKETVATFWTHMRVPGAFLALVVMLCIIRLFYWSYLDMADPEDEIEATIDLPMNVSKINFHGESPPNESG